MGVRLSDKNIRRGLSAEVEVSNKDLISFLEL